MNICILIGTLRPNVAYEVMTENISLIKSSGIDLIFLADKLLEKKIINERKKKAVTDRLTGLTENERMDELIHILMKSIEVKGKEVFDIFLEILKKEDTRLSLRLAKKLSDAYNAKIDGVNKQVSAKIDDADKQVSINEGKNKTIMLPSARVKFGVPVNTMCKNISLLFTAFNSIQHLVMPRHLREARTSVGKMLLLRLRNQVCIACFLLKNAS